MQCDVVLMKFWQFVTQVDELDVELRRITRKRVLQHQRTADHHHTITQYRVMRQRFGHDLGPDACGVTQREREWLDVTHTYAPAQQAT